MERGAKREIFISHGRRRYWRDVVGIGKLEGGKSRHVDWVGCRDESEKSEWNCVQLTISDCAVGEGEKLGEPFVEPSGETIARGLATALWSGALFVGDVCGSVTI